MAKQHNIDLDGFHDAGWTSVVAVGRRLDGQAVILKACYDPDRFDQEQAALVHWGGRGACRLLDNDATDRVLLMELIGGAAGGARRPAQDAEQVATALPRLHRVEVQQDNPVPTLVDYYRHTVLPRIQERAKRHGSIVGDHFVRQAVKTGVELCAVRHRPLMLHADLYAENVLFDANGGVVFIDPHPKIGSAAFDWAFWCVYYRQDRQFDTRVKLCRQHVPELTDEVLAWSLTLAVDGALYFLDTEDSAAEDVCAVLASSEFTHILQ
jgi:streptomycin 6-kinase